MIRAHKDLTKPMLGSAARRCSSAATDGCSISARRRCGRAPGSCCATSGSPNSVDLVAAMNAALAKRGVRFLVASPPNGSTVYEDELPDWAQNHGRRTEYDLFLAGLAATGRAGGRPAAGDGGGADGRRRLLPPRHALDARAARSRRSTRSSRPTAIPTGRLDPATALDAAFGQEGRRSRPAARRAGRRDGEPSRS